MRRVKLADSWTGGCGPGVRRVSAAVVRPVRQQRVDGSISSPARTRRVKYSGAHAPHSERTRRVKCSGAHVPHSERR